MSSSQSKQQFLDKLHQLPAGSLLVFVITEAWAALFGILLVLAMIILHFVELPWLSPYDWLFVAAVLIQLGMLLAKLEKPHEVITIVSFHLVGLGMELFKTSSAIHAWSYPGPSVIKLGAVPLFSGFMYAAVGSYIARAWRVMHLEFTNYPLRRYTVLLALAIYINFFSHHFTYDLRYVLFAACLLLFGRVMVSFTLTTRIYRMPFVISALLIAAVIWLAENISTLLKIWLYPSQTLHWHPVSVEKIGSWLLLMIISIIIVDLLHFCRARIQKQRLERTQV